MWSAPDRMHSLSALSVDASLTAVRPASRRHSCVQAGYAALKRPPGRQARWAGVSPRHYFPLLHIRHRNRSKLSLDDSEPMTGEGRLRPDASLSAPVVPAVPESARRAVRGEYAGTSPFGHRCRQALLHPSAASSPSSISCFIRLSLSL